MEGMEQVVWVFRGLQEDLGFELRVVGVLEGCGQRRWNLTWVLTGALWWPLQGQEARKPFQQSP